MMADLILLRGMANVIACLIVRSLREGHSAGLGQDKSRKVRSGRAVEECRRIKHRARGATGPRNFLNHATYCDFRVKRTSRVPAP
jgi:hypothetical protein